MKYALIINKSFKIISELWPEHWVQNVKTRKNPRHIKNARRFVNFGQKNGILHKTPIKCPQINHHITGNLPGTFGAKHLAKYRFVPRKYREICPS